MAEILDGKITSAAIRAQIKKDVEDLVSTSGVTPGLAVIIVGDDPASQVYVRNKKRSCEEVGIRSLVITMPRSVPEAKLIEKINELNLDTSVHGILVQLPLPPHISEERVIEAISVQKDVDAFHPYNVGRLFTGDYTFLPCTPAGVMLLLQHYNVEISGKRCVVVGRSNIVGKPMALLLLEQNGTVTVCHSRTVNLSEEIRGADILVVAVGKPRFVTGDMIKPGAVVVDVGINRTDDGKLVGDVDFDSAKDVARYITPVPGGVGPMTITTLLKNTVTAARASLK